MYLHYSPFVPVDFHGDHKAVTKLRLICPTPVSGDYIRLKTVIIEQSVGDIVTIMKDICNLLKEMEVILWGLQRRILLADILVIRVGGVIRN